MTEKAREQIRLVLIDDHPLIRDGLQTIIRQQDWLHLAGQAANRTEAVRVVSHEQPDVVLLDLRLGDCNGLELLPELRLAAPQSRVLILTASHNRDEHCAALRQGAMGVVLKDQEVDVLLRAIDRVSAGEAWLDHSLMSLLWREPEEHSEPALSTAGRIALLTEREREVIALVGQGLKNRKIADQLCISEVTVRHHLTSVFNKLQLKDRLELAVYAWRHGLAAVPRTSAERHSHQVSAVAGAD